MQLSDPFMGMWLASHRRLGHYIRHPLWKKETLLQRDDINWGYPEKSNSGLLFADVPEGFQTTNVVPYDPVKQVLLPFGQISHERNGYSVLKGGLASIYVEDIFKPADAVH